MKAEIVKSFRSKKISIHILKCKSSYYTTWCGRDADVVQLFDHAVEELRNKNEYKRLYSYRPKLTLLQAENRFHSLIQSLQFVSFE